MKPINLVIQDTFKTPSWVYLQDALAHIKYAIEALERAKVDNTDRQLELPSIQKEIGKLMIAYVNLQV